MSPTSPNATDKIITKIKGIQGNILEHMNFLLVKIFSEETQTKCAKSEQSPRCHMLYGTILRSLWLAFQQGIHATRRPLLILSKHLTGHIHHKLLSLRLNLSLLFFFPSVF